MESRGRKYIWAAVALVAILAIGVLVERLRGVVALRDWERQARAAGERLSLPELASARVPIGEAEIIDPEEFASRASGFSIRMTLPTPARIAGPGRIVPQSTQPKVNTYQASDASWETLDQHLQPLEAEIVRFKRDCLAGRTVVRHSYDVAARPPVHYASLIRIAEVLAARVLVDLHGQRFSRAHDSLLLLLDMDRLLANEPLRAAQGARFSVAYKAHVAIWEALQHAGWTDSQLAELQSGCEKGRFLDALAPALEVERARHDAMFHLIRTYSEPPGQAAIRDVMIDSDYRGGGLVTESVGYLLGQIVVASSPIRRAWQSAMWRFAWSYHDQLELNRRMQSLIDQVRDMAAGRSALREFSRQESQALFNQPRSYYSRLRYRLSHTARYNDFILTAVNTMACRQLTIAAIAIERHRLKHGKRPPTLETLVPEFLSAAPRDPFDGEAIRYVIGPAGEVILYAVGGDGTDDGGRASQGAGFFGQAPPRSDLLWPAPAAPPPPRPGTFRAAP